MTVQTSPLLHAGRSLLLLLASLLLALGLTSCPGRPGEPAGSAAPGKAGNSPSDAAGGNTSSSASSEPTKIDGKDAIPAPTGDVRQVILIYTGDTISAMESQTKDDPPHGGLSALAATVMAYQREIVEFTAKRVENEGGDPSTVRADFAAGTLGPHPRLLVDYGGWERPNDPVGRIYEQLYANYFHDFAYTAVGGMRYQELKPELWRSYKQFKNPPTVLISAGTPLKGVSTADLLPTVKVVTRECHGQTWGIACLPVPAPDELTPQNPSEAPLEADYTATVNSIAAKNCDFRILLAAGLPAKFYTGLADKLDFDIVIGGPLGLAVKEGMGELPQGGPLLLPALEKAGRQIGICHLIYSTAGTAPTQYNFILRDVIDTGSQKQPYFRQVFAAKAEHEQKSRALKKNKN